MVHQTSIAWFRLGVSLQFTGKSDWVFIFKRNKIHLIIFTDRSETENLPTTSDALQPGRKQVAAGYALYGSATAIVISLGNGVNGFTYDPSIGEFILTDVNMRIPSQGKIYSINEGYSHLWDDSVKRYIAAKKDPTKGEPYGARYVGSMVADVVSETFRYDWSKYNFY